MKRKQRTREEKLAIVADWKESGLTPYQYHKKRGVAPVLIQRWAAGEQLGGTGTPTKRKRLPKSNAVFQPVPPKLGAAYDEIREVAAEIGMPVPLLVEQALRFALDHMEKP